MKHPAPRTARLVDLAQRNRHAFRRNFPSWLARHRSVFDCFELEAYQLHKQGTEHYSAARLAEQLRDKYRIPVNNNHVASMAWPFNLLHPKQAIFRTTRQL